MKVTWLLQGSFLFESQGFRLLIDPYISDIVEKKQGVTRLAPPPLRAAELHPAAIYCTHNHMDHLDPVGLPEILKLNPRVRVAGPVSIARKFAELGLDAACVDVLPIGARHRLGPFELTVVKAYHSDPEATGLLLAAEGLLVYLSGDTLYQDALPAQILAAAGDRPLDYAFICINGRLGNMNADEALRTVAALKAEAVVPMHYGLFAENTADPAPFVAACRAAGQRALALAAGEPTELPAHVPSLLPAGKQWHLVWRDEFDGDTLDRSKWGFRRHLMQQRHQTFTEDGVELDGQSCVHLKLSEKDGQYYSPHLQTGENFMDRPPETAYGKFRWPIAKLGEQRFLHKYGYYECRCKLPANSGWWCAFWLQSPMIGATADPVFSGVEVDIMENFAHDGKISNKVITHNNHWNGYGADYRTTKNSGDRVLKETPDGFHVFGLDWSPSGYVYYVDGVESWRVDGPVSDREQFVLISTECSGYRQGDSPAPELKQAILPDAFVVDYVRVYDEVKTC